MEDLLKVGVITTTHGVRGEVKVFPTTDDAERFLDIEYVLLDTGKELRRLNIQNVKFFKNLAILKFEGIDNINDIEMYKGRELWIPREEAQELGEDEYYVADLIGMEVLLEFPGCLFPENPEFLPSLSKELRSPLSDAADFPL